MLADIECLESKEKEEEECNDLLKSIMSSDLDKRDGGGMIEKSDNSLMRSGR